MVRNRIFWPRGSSAARSLVAGLVLLMSILGCAHLGKSPSPASTAGSTSRPSETADAPKGSAAREDAAALPSATSGASHPADNESTQTGSASATGAKHDQSPGAGTSSKNEADNTPVAKARSSSGGTATGTKTPSPVKGGSASDKEQPGAAGNGPPTLGLTEIEQRLRDTHAIGVFTKLSLKNQIDDLLGQLRAYHLKQTSVSLPQLRQRYDVLLQRVIGLLQSGDAPLAKDISSSREAIWSLLTNSTTISQL
jgi:hypothetical protein